MTSLAAGTRLGPYELEGVVGAGGMGEVYRARDERLGRIVAIKILPDELGRDPAARERFEREARAIAALSHPHICAIHDVGREGDTSYLVLEYLDGETLSARLKRATASRSSGAVGDLKPSSRSGRGIELDQALRWGIQIADALAAAHRQGIVHRDLKPGNIMLTRAGVKLLDFGLAKQAAPAAEAETRSDDRAGSPSHTSARTKASLTDAAKMVGTLPYMAPEQLEGTTVDARSDLFALGLVLYELVSGRRAFEARSEAGMIAAILEHDPPSLAELTPHVPAALTRLVHDCLAKDPDDRWQSASDVRRELTTILDGLATRRPSHGGVRRRGSRIVGMVATIAVISAAALGWIAGRAQRPKQDPSAREVHFQIAVPALVDDAAMIPRISPDGRKLAVVVREGTQRRIALRPLDTKTIIPVPGTEGAANPFWSADGRHLAFVADEKLKRVELGDGAVRIIAAMPGVFNGGSWSNEGQIVFSQDNALYRVSGDGGEPTPLGPLGVVEPGVARIEPQLLPDGRRFVFFESPHDRSRRGLRLSSLDDPSVVQTLWRSDTSATVGPGSFLLYGEACALKARRFDLERGVATTESFTIVEQVRCDGLTGRRPHSVSRDGTLVYRPPIESDTQLTWFDRTGKRLAPFGPAGAYRNFDLAADDRRVVTAQRDRRKGTTSLYLLEERATEPSLVVAGDDIDLNDPVWSHDGRSIMYGRAGSPPTIMRTDVSGSAQTNVFHQGQEFLYPEDWSVDERRIALVRWHDHLHDLAVLTLPNELTNVAAGLRHPDEGRFSPTDLWLAYCAATPENDAWQVFVEALPPAKDRSRASAAGGIHPRWSADGRQLYFLGLDGTMNVVDVRRGKAGAPELSAPRVLFATPLQPHGYLDQFAVTSDGTRFLLALPSRDDRGANLDVVLGWTARFAASVPEP